MNEEQLNQILGEIRQDQLSDGEVAASQARVWAKLSVPSACTAFRAQLPAYVAGELPEQCRLLLEDHLGRCVVSR